MSRKELTYIDLLIVFAAIAILANILYPVVSGQGVSPRELRMSSTTSAK